jgi:hypothetical protein
LEDGNRLITWSTYIIVGIEYVLAVERYLQTLIVTVLDAEVEEYLGIHPIVQILTIGLEVQFPADV